MAATRAAGWGPSGTSLLVVGGSAWLSVRRRIFVARSVSHGCSRRRRQVADRAPSRSPARSAQESAAGVFVPDRGETADGLRGSRAGRAKNQTWKCALPSPHRPTCTRPISPRLRRTSRIPRGARLDGSAALPLARPALPAHRWGCGPQTVRNDMLLLTTRGSRTGKPHTVPLLYLRDGDTLVVIASWGGRPDHPDWYRNLSSDPRATVQVRSNAGRARALRERRRACSVVASNRGGLPGVPGVSGAH